MSRSIDIVAEYKAALAAVTDRFRRRFAQLGLIAPANRIGLAGVARVVERRGGIYEPDPAGLMAVVLPIWDGPISDARVVVEAPDRLIDLVAWRPAADAPLMTRLGQAQLLGAEALSVAVISGDPLRIFRDPGGWARAGGAAAGIVVIDWTADVGLLGLKAVIADDIEHGAEVKTRLKKLRARLVGRVPQIRVPISAGTAA